MEDYPGRSVEQASRPRFMEWLAEAAPTLVSIFLFVALFVLFVGYFLWGWLGGAGGP
jgi:ABC-type multidrug transport system permease subunit